MSESEGLKSSMQGDPEAEGLSLSPEERPAALGAALTPTLSAEDLGVALPSDAMWTPEGQARSRALSAARPAEASGSRALTAARSGAAPRAVAIGGVGCGGCGAAIPPGMTFCPSCGGAARWATQAQQRGLLIARFGDEARRGRFVRWVVQAHPHLDRAEVIAASTREPALYPIRVSADQGHALEQGLRSLGIDAQVLEPGQIPAAWLREALWPWWSSPLARFVGIGVAGAIILVFFALGPLFLLGGVFALVVALGVALRQMGRRSGLSPDFLLDSIAGLDAALVASLRGLLSDLRDEELRDCLTVCILEYRALSDHLRDVAPSVGGLMGESQEMLRRLIEQWAAAGQRFLALERYTTTVDRARLEATVARGQAQVEGDAAQRERQQKVVDQVRTQLQAVDALERDAARLKAQLVHLTSTVEAFRARALAATMGASGGASSLDEIIQEIDQEMDVLEETVREVKAL